MNLEELILRAEERLASARSMAAHSRRQAERYDAEAVDVQRELDALKALREPPRNITQQEKQS